MLLARRIRDACPGAFVRRPAPDCEKRLDRDEVKRLLQDDSETRQARTMARLALGDPETAGIGHFLLAQSSSELAEPTASAPLTRRPACSDQATATLLLDAYESFLARGRLDERTALWTDFSSLAGCVDVDAFGLGARVGAIARRERSRMDAHYGIAAWALAHNGSSADMARLFVEEFSAGSAPHRLRLLLTLDMTTVAEAATGPLCQGLLPHALDPDSEVAVGVTSLFVKTEGDCRAHRDSYLDLLESGRKKTPRPSLAGAVWGLPLLCDKPDLTAAQRRRSLDLATTFADPRNPAAPERTRALEALCLCDKARARPLVRKAKASTDQSEREMALSESCR